MRVWLIVGLCIGLGACGLRPKTEPVTPPQEVPRLSQLDEELPKAETASLVAPAASAERGSFFQRLMRGIGGPNPAEATSESAPTDAADPAAPRATAAAPSDAGPDTAQAVAQAVASAQSLPEKAPEKQPGTAPETPAATPQPARAGFFAGLFGFAKRSPQPSAPSDSAAPAPQADPNAPVPFGEVVKQCRLPSKDRGHLIARAGGMALYDSFPNSTAPRPHYLTGFSDGCARKFTAALAMFGDPRAHETKRYTQRGRYSEVDDAYERIKARICRVSRKRPCGAQINRMRRAVAMVSGYARFGETDEWTEILVHDRKLTAISTHGR